MNREIDTSPTPHGKRVLILLDTGEFIVEERNFPKFPSRPPVYFEDEEEALRYWEAQVYTEYSRRLGFFHAREAAKGRLRKVLDAAGLMCS